MVTIAMAVGAATKEMAEAGRRLMSAAAFDGLAIGLRDFIISLGGGLNRAGPRADITSPVGNAEYAETLGKALVTASGFTVNPETALRTQPCFAPAASFPIRLVCCR